MNELRRNRLLGLAAVGVVLVVLHLGRAIVIPFLLGALVAIGVSGVVRFANRRMPRWASAMVACLIAIGICAGLGALLTLAFEDLAVEWSTYQRSWERMQVDVVRWFASRRLGEPASALRELEPEEAAMRLALPGLAIIAEGASNFMLVLLIAVFLIVEGAVVSEKLARLEHLGAVDAGLWRSTAVEVQRYLLIKTGTSVLTGILAGGLTAAVGLEHPLLFGLVAFLLNYIPTVGSLVAMAPAVFIGVLTLGWSTGFILLLGYGALNVGIGIVLEPRWLGTAVGLSPSIVFLSMVFWAFVLGPVGALLSVPLMMIVRIAAGQSPQWEWLAILLASPREMRHSRTS